MMRFVPVAILLLLAIGFAVGRFFVPTHELSLAGTYEALAHVFVGSLIGAYWVGRSWAKAAVQPVEFAFQSHHVYLFLLIALTAVEVYVFFTTR